MKTEKTVKKEKVTWGDVFPKYRISMINNGRTKRVRIEGAKKLLLCIDREVKISLGEETFHAHGKDLSCVSYASGAVEEKKGKRNELQIQLPEPHCGVRACQLS